MSVIVCRYCADELEADVPPHELREDARNIGWAGNVCPGCQNEMDWTTGPGR